MKKIQNNVRGWLLRKNYVNLREAAKVLQGQLSTSILTVSSNIMYPRNIKDPLNIPLSTFERPRKCCKVSNE